MHDQANTGRESKPDIGHADIPVVVDRARFQTELEALRVRERRTPAKVTRSPPPADGFRWWSQTPPPR
jgi:hypothetical protein